MGAWIRRAENRGTETAATTVEDGFGVDTRSHVGNVSPSFLVFEKDRVKPRPVALHGTARPAWAEEQLHACLTSFRKKECLLVLNLYNFSIEYRFLILFSQLCFIRRDDQN